MDYMARPTKYNKDDMEPKIKALCHEGASFAEICSEIGISRQTGYNWIDEKGEFFDIIEFYSTRSQAWWENQGRTQLENKDFNATLFNKQIAGRFPKDWRDSSINQLTGPDGGAIKTETTVTGADDGVLELYYQQRKAKEAGEKSDA
jgi:hypothetical protein